MCAFVSRARRDSGVRGGGAAWESTTKAHVGPGSYTQIHEYTTEMSYAPFSSTSERLFHEKRTTSMSTPGPGAYRAEWASGNSFARAAPRVGSSSSSNIFKTGVPRLASELPGPSGPGPGSYNLMQEWIKPRAGRHSRGYAAAAAAAAAPGPEEFPPGGAPPEQQQSTTRLVYRKRATAPSVPARNQSYGYEETSTGDLILQSAPKVGFTGIKDDTVGPGRYRPALRPTHRFTDFSRSTTTRKLFSTNTNPGPGQYQSGAGEAADAREGSATTRTARTGVRSAPAMPSSNFASKVKKLADNAAEKERTPGPGSYNVSSRGPPLFSSPSRDDPEPLRSGSSAGADLVGFPGGPAQVGHHHHHHHHRAPEAREHRPPPPPPPQAGHNAHGFLSTVSRSYEIDETRSHAAPTPLLTPGPGTYQNEQSSFFSRQSTYKDPMSMESASHVAPFSSTSRRFR